MKNKSIRDDEDPLDREFDLSKARPNPHWLGAVDRKCVRLIEKDLAELFPDNESENAAPYDRRGGPTRRTVEGERATRVSGPKTTTSLMHSRLLPFASLRVGVSCAIELISPSDAAVGARDAGGRHGLPRGRAGRSLPLLAASAVLLKSPKLALVTENTVRPRVLRATFR
jgi:hypothetical protein